MKPAAAPAATASTSTRRAILEFYHGAHIAPSRDRRGCHTRSRARPSRRPRRTDHPCPRDPDGPFGALVRAIVYQQLAGRAAQAIHGRLRTTVGDSLTPAAFAATPDPALRAAGLSANKLASLRDLSAKVIDGTVVLTRTSSRSDEELIAGLSPYGASAAGPPRCT